MAVDRRCKVTSSYVFFLHAVPSMHKSATKRPSTVSPLNFTVLRGMIQKLLPAVSLSFSPSSPRCFRFTARWSICRFLRISSSWESDFGTDWIKRMSSMFLGSSEWPPSGILVCCLHSGHRIKPPPPPAASEWTELLEEEEEEVVPAHWDGRSEVQASHKECPQDSTRGKCSPSS